MMAKKRYGASQRIKKRKNTRKIFGLVVRLAVPVIFLTLIIFVVRADFLKVRDIEVVGDEFVGNENIKEVIEEEIQGDKLLFVPNSNILFLNKDDVAGVLLARFGRIKKVKVNKEFFSKNLEVTLEERKEEFLWCSRENECFSMSSEGLVFEKEASTASKQATSSPKIIFRGGIDGDPLMKNFATSEKMQNYMKAISVLQDADFKVLSWGLESSDKIVVGTNIGDIYLNPNDKNLGDSAKNAIILIKDIKSKNPSASFLYVDARFGNKVFYKLN